MSCPLKRADSAPLQSGGVIAKQIAEHAEQ
jgi:hypothetical protein